MAYHTRLDWLTALEALGRNVANTPWYEARLARDQQAVFGALPALTGYEAPVWHSTETTVTTTRRRPSVSCKGCGAPVEDRCEYCGRRV
jgi:hypothetical protein